MRNVFLLFAILSMFSTFAQQGQGTVIGLVLDDSGYSVPFANVTVIKNDIQILGTATDFDGNFVLVPLPPDTYTVKVSIVGYQSVLTEGIISDADSTTYLEVKLKEGIALSDTIVEYKKPDFIVNQVNGATRITPSITKLAERPSADVVKTVEEGNFSRVEGSACSCVRGRRSGASVVFINEVKRLPRGTLLPGTYVIEAPIELTGVPAEYENKEKWEGIDHRSYSR